MGEDREELPCLLYIYIPNSAKNGRVLLQTTVGFPVQPSLAPVVRDTGVSVRAHTHALQGREGLVWGYCVHKYGKTEQGKTNALTAASVGSPLHPPFFSKV